MAIYLYRSTPSHSEICLLAVQRVEAELESVAASQQQGSRDIQKLRDDVKSIKEDLSTLLASARSRGNDSSSTLSKLLYSQC